MGFEHKSPSPPPNPQAPQHITNDGDNDDDDEDDEDDESTEGGDIPSRRDGLSVDAEVACKGQEKHGTAQRVVIPYMQKAAPHIT